MTENLRFSGAGERLERQDLTENEIKTISRAGLTAGDFFEIVSGQPLAEGSRALIFELPGDNQKSVAKVWKDRTRDSDRAAVEGIALRLLKMRNFKNAPQLEGHLKSASIVFEEKIEGEPVKDFNNEVIDKLAVALADLHSIKLHSYGKPFTQRKFGTRLDYLHDSVKTLRDICQSFNNQGELVGLVNDALNKIESAANNSSEAFAGNDFTLIHFDLNPGNILYSKDRGDIIIIDWEQASAGDSAMDIAKLFLKADFNADQRREFLEQYKNHSVDDDPNFFERLQVYDFFVLINSILWRLRVLRDMPEQISKETEKRFYDQVKNRLNNELNKLKSELSQ